MALTAARIARLREGTYEAGKSHVVYFQDGDTLRDAADLYAILSEHHNSTGSPNLENTIAKGFVEQIQSGSWLSNAQLGKLLELVKKYSAELRAYRASGDRSQDVLHVPSGADAKILR